MVHKNPSAPLTSRGIELIQMDTNELDENYQVDPHTHHMLEISCIKGGEGVYEIGDKSFQLTQGDVVILGNNEYHRIVVGKGQQLVNLVAHFEPQFIWNTLSHDIDYQFLRIFYEKDDTFPNRLDRDNPATKEIFQLLLDIESEYGGRLPAKELMIKVRLMNIFALLVRNFDFHSKSPVAQGALRVGKGLEEMARVMEYIQNNISAEITLESLAEIACMAPTYFSAHFKKWNGVSPFNYIASRRVQNAIEYIRTSSMSMTEIAQTCGFNTSANFNKTFKKITGYPPSHYRK